MFGQAHRHRLRCRPSAALWTKAQASKARLPFSQEVPWWLELMTPSVSKSKTALVAMLSRSRSRWLGHPAADDALHLAGNARRAVVLARPADLGAPGLISARSIK